MKGPFADKVVYLTGASSGIGEALALLLARDGARLALVARRQDLLEKVAGKAQKLGGRALALPADAGDRAEVARALEATKEALGPVDVLIANAGVSERIFAERFSADLFAQQVQVNLLGVVYAIEGVLPDMLARGSGQIAAVSSLAGWRGLPFYSAYSATKGALQLMLESLRVELRPKGITVSGVYPGFVRTPMTDKNAFPMPFMISAEQAARCIARGLAARRAEIAFPWPAAAAMKLVRVMPKGLYDRLGSPLLRMQGRF